MTDKKSINSTLHRGKRNKNDEFYTRQQDIENEMRWYKDEGVFKGKIVFCNCDDPVWSDFWKYFSLFFKTLGLKKLIATHYKEGEQTYKLEYYGKGKEIKTPLRIEQGWPGDGDFRSPECIELMKEADIIMTNPPFSLFQEYVSLLIEHEKQFLIIGNLNSITSKKLIPYVIKNKMWIGCTPEKGDLKFKVPKDYEAESSRLTIDENGQKWMTHGNTLWITNLPHKKRENMFIDLTRIYKGNENDYPFYDNHPDIIEVGEYKKIPKDYEGLMGVPTTFLKKHNPNQFDLVGADWQLLKKYVKEHNIEEKWKTHRFVVNGETRFARVVIKHRRKPR